MCTDTAPAQSDHERSGIIGSLDTGEGRMYPYLVIFGTLGRQRQGKQRFDEVRIRKRVPKSNESTSKKERSAHRKSSPYYSPKVTVWAALSARGVIGPYFYEDSKGCAVAVKSELFCKLHL